MYFVVTRYHNRIPMEWSCLSAYEKLEISSADRHQLCGKRKDGAGWDVIIERDTRQQVEDWCHDNIPIGRRYL
jgi:hypothetical protein